MSTEERLGPADTATVSRSNQVISGVLTLIVVVAVFAGIFPRFADYGGAWDAAKRMTLASVGVLLGITIANLIVYAWPFQAAARRLSFSDASLARHTTFMISNAIPAGGAIGLGVGYSMLSSFGLSGGGATAAIGITALWNVLVTIGLPVLAVVLLVIGGEPSSTDIGLAVGGVTLIAVVLAFLAGVFRSEALAERIGSLADRAAEAAFGVLRRPRRVDVTNAILTFRSETVEVVRARWFAITWTNVLTQLTQFGILYAALWGIPSGSSSTVPLIQAFAAFVFARLASFIPITPGGLGTVDAAMVALLGQFGATNADAVASVLLWRALSFFPSVILGAIMFLVWRGRTQKKPPKRAADIEVPAGRRTL